MSLRWPAFAIALIGAVPAVAQPDGAPPLDDAGTHEQPRLVAPAVVDAPEPPFPEQAIAAGFSHGVVVLRVTLDAQGRVTASELVEPAGHGFDEAAQRVALEYRFEPAYRDGQPIAARILLRIEFHRPSPPPTAATAAPPVPPPSPGATAGPPVGPSHASIEVTVAGHSEAERLRRSAEAVHVVDTERAKRQTADLAEVLARTHGVGVQRAGGFGSEARFSLNGLTDDQIRFFLDGVPLDFAGYPFGIANVPINFVERVEIYRGVVPIRFGADALGGAVNVVTDRGIRGTHASAAYMAGSFGTHLATLAARHLDEGSGWFSHVSAFVDRADNDYPMDVEVADDRGRVTTARVYRFHDAYAAQGAALETGLVDKPWADRLTLRGFLTHYDKEIQHNLLMTFNPYGDVELSQRSAGVSLRYEHGFADGFSVSGIAGYVHGRQHYTDIGQCTYDWFGRCVRRRAQPGERTGRAADQRYGEHDAYGRVSLEWRAHPQHAVRVSLSPTYTVRTGDERRQANPDARDPLSAERHLLTFVSGVEYELDLFGERLENVLFVKDYLQVLRSEDPRSDGGSFRRRDRETHRLGIGNGLRYAFADWIYAKLSYEWATRLPRADEIFGNAFPVQPNLELEPELSHNLNVGVTADAELAGTGRLRGDLNAFLRETDQLILLVGNDQAATYQNVFAARSLGFELGAGWTSPGEHLELQGNLTYVDFRNTSDEGAFARNEGQRIPNRPYLFGNASARIQFRDVATARDELALVWTTRHVGEFFRGWEEIGAFKLTVDAQLLHSLALTYLVESDDVRLTFTGEVQNLTDQAAFDFYGVPRPGRAVYFKATAAL